MLSKQQEADLKKTINECEVKLDEVRQIVQTNLWSCYGQDKLRAAVKEAERACDNVAATPVSAVNRDGYEMQMIFMEKMVNEATQSLACRELWIPAAERADLDSRVKDIKASSNKLEARRAEFAIAQRIAEEEKTDSMSTAAGNMAATQATTIVRIKPISLPKFHAIARGIFTDGSETGRACKNKENQPAQTR